jgi:hypothetical protein
MCWGFVKSEDDFGIVSAFAVGGCKHLKRWIFVAHNIGCNPSDIR